MHKKILALILFLVYLFPQTSVQAQGIDLSVSPPIFEIELTPPAKAEVEETIVLTNNGDSQLDLTLQMRQFIAGKDNNGTIEYLPEDEPIRGSNPNILERISVLDEASEKIETVTLPPRSEKKLSLSVSIPKDEPPSDYYFSLVFLSVAEDGKNNQTTTSGGVGINVLLSIGPKSPSTAIVEEFSTQKFTNSGPVPFTTRIKNTSKHFLYPKGQIIIHNMFGQTVGNVELIPVNILANTTRAIPSREQVVFEANKEANPEDLDESVLEKLSSINPVSIWNEKFLLGPYTATLRLALTDEGPLIEKRIWFFALPIQLIIGVIIAVLSVLIVRSRLKLREKRS